MKVYGANDLGSTPGAISHSCQPLSCSAAARQNDANGSGRGNASFPHSRAKKPERMAWSVCRITNIGSLVCWIIINGGRRPTKPRGAPLSTTRREDSSTTAGTAMAKKPPFQGSFVLPVREWRNWQTQQPYELPDARPCRFKSSLPPPHSQL